MNTKNTTLRARALFVCGMLSALSLATACNPGDMLGSSGDSGSSTYTPDYSLPPPPHSASLPCQDPDTNHLCVALNYVSYEGGPSQPIVAQAQALQNVQNISSLWAQCNIQFYLENYQAADPSTSGLPYQPESMDDLTNVRSAFPSSNELTVVTTGQWTGDLGAQAPNAWTEMPPVGPFGVVMEASVSTIYNLIAHELGHYMNLVHVADEYNVMNPTIYANSLNLTADQCSEARATAISFWGAMLR